MKRGRTCLALWAATWLVVTAVSFCPASPLPGLPDGVVLDEDQPSKSKASIDLAIAANQINVVFVAMHNGIEVRYCWEKLPLLTKTKQAELLARLLQDEQFVESWEYTRNHGYIGSNLSRELRASTTERTAYELLGEASPPPSNMTRAQLDALVAKLRAVK